MILIFIFLYNVCVELFGIIDINLLCAKFFLFMMSPSLTGSRIFFDNKLDFSGIKLAESYGLRYSNFKVPSK